MARIVVEGGQQIERRAIVEMRDDSERAEREERLSAAEIERLSQMSS